MVRNKPPSRMSPMIPLTASKTASSMPPTTTDKPSLNKSMIETIQPMMGTLSNVSATLPNASPSLPPIFFAPLPNCTRPSYAPLRLPDESFCKPPITLLMLVLRLFALSVTVCCVCVATPCIVSTFFAAASASSCAASTAALAVFCCSSVPLFSASV